MATGGGENPGRQSTKRKRDPSTEKTKPKPKSNSKKADGDKSKAKTKNTKKVADVAATSGAAGGGEFASLKRKQPEKTTPQSAMDRRLAAKEMVEARKMRRKPNYTLEKELAVLWEKMRCHDVSKEDRSKYVSQALRKMNGKFLDIVGSHVSARVLQTCVKYCSEEERNGIFDSLKPHLLALSQKKYAIHLVKKLLHTASKRQFEWFLSSLHGHVVPLLRHKVGASVVDFAFHKAKGAQKRSLLMELYSTELQLFKDLTLTNSARLVDVISKLGLQKSSVLQQMTIVLQQLLEKGIVEYSIVHTAILEYLTIAAKSSAADVVRQLTPLLTQGLSSTDEEEPSSTPASQRTKAKKKLLAEPLLVRMIHTREGLKLGIACLKYSSPKVRKKIIKGLKGQIKKLAFDQYGCLLLICIISVVDDTKLVTKHVIHELQKVLKELVFDKNGRRPLLQLLHPQCPRYLSPDDLTCLNYYFPFASPQTEDVSKNPSQKCSEDKVDVSTDNVTSSVSEKGTQEAYESKKDSFLRRSELLIESGLAEKLVQTCIENVGELLRSNFGKEVLYEVAVGGTDGILQPLADRIDELHKAIASVATGPKTNESEEHVFENFHASRTIRKLILECPKFAAILWKTALQGKCEIWAQGYSSKVVAAFVESSDSMVKDLAKLELQPLVEGGILKIPEHKPMEKEV